MEIGDKIVIKSTDRRIAQIPGTITSQTKTCWRVTREDSGTELFCKKDNLAYHWSLFTRWIEKESEET